MYPYVNMCELKLRLYKKKTEKRSYQITKNLKHTEAKRLSK